MRPKRILYLSHRIPYPPNKGDKIRSYHQVKYLARHSVLDLIAWADDPGDLRYAQALTRICRKVKILSLNKAWAKLKGIASLTSGSSITQGYFYSRRFQAIVDEWIKTTPYDAIVCFSSPMAAYVMNPETELRPKRFMDFCDLDSDKWMQYSRSVPFPLTYFFRLEGERLMRFERQVADGFDQSIFVSRKEADLFEQAFPGVKSPSVVPNGVDYRYFSPDSVEPARSEGWPMLMFSGAMDYYANVEGVCWFVESIFPGIRKQFPKAVFYIVGSNPDARVRALGSRQGIVVTGFVEDIRQYYRGADLCVVPLNIARGVQNKVLEAMAMAKPVVATSMALQGIGASADRELLAADRPDAFTQKCILMIENREMAEQYGKAARQFVQRHHDWDKLLNGFYSLLFDRPVEKGGESG